MTSESLRLEANRATVFFVGQMKKGWTAEEAMQQVRSSYGMLVWAQVKWDLQEYFRRK